MNSPAGGPEPPTDYALVAFELRLACGAVCGRWPAGGLSLAVEALRAAGAGVVVALAWFAERSLDECPDARWRLVSVRDSQTGGWSGWVPEELEGRPGHAEPGEPRRATAKGFRWAKRPGP